MLGQNSRETAHIPARSAEARSAGPRLCSKRWALLAGKTGVACWNAPLFSLLPQGAAFRRGYGPHFSFVLPKEKSPPQRWKRKALVSKLAVERKFGEYGSQLFCSETCLSLRGTGGVRRLSSPVRRDDQTANLWVRKGHPQFLFPRSSRCSALPVPRMSGSGSGTGSRGRPLCSPVNAALSNAGTQFCKERLSAQPVGGFGVCMAVCTERSPRCSALSIPQMSASGSETRSRGRPLCSPVNAALPNAGMYPL